MGLLISRHFCLAFVGCDVGRLICGDPAETLLPQYLG